MRYLKDFIHKTIFFFVYRGTLECPKFLWAQFYVVGIIFFSLLFSAKFLVMSGPTETSSRSKTLRNIRVIDINGNVDDISSTHIEDYNNVIVGGEIAAIIDSKLLFCGGSSAG